jgi:DNA-binding IclR family transcriptional regulator
MRASFAIEPLERAYALGQDTDPGTYAEIQSALGRALVDAHRDEQRGMTLTQAAQQEFEQDRREADELQDLLKWRRRHH